MNRICFDEFKADTVAGRFEAAMEYLRANPGTTLVIPDGDYVISSDRARETMENAIYGGYGENPESVMFKPDYAFTEGVKFHGVRDAVIEAHGARLMVDGFMEPLAMKECADIVIDGLTIDYVRKPFSMGIVESFKRGEEEGTAEIGVRFDGRFPVDERTIMPRVCVYDIEKQYFHIGFGVSGREYLGDGRFLIKLRRVPDIDMTGMEFYIWHSFHYRPAVLIENAEGITLKNVTIHAQPGMGIVGHRSTDILLSCIRIVPSEGLHMSTNTDATHFTSCRGSLRFENCEFDGHGDDATNVHTFYHDFAFEDDTKKVVRTKVNTLTHSLTLDYPDAGDVLELNDKKTLLPIGTFTVIRSEPDFSGGTCLVTLDRPLPGAPDDYFLSNITAMPRLEFVNCSCNNHWARSVLIKTRHAAVTGCTFRASALMAIHIAAEGSWLEGVAPADITVENNRFVLCGAPARKQIGGICVEMQAESPNGTPIDGIKIIGNEFDLPNAETAVVCSNAKSILISGNTVRTSSDAPFVITDCENVEISGNIELCGN